MVHPINHLFNSPLQSHLILADFMTLAV